MSGLFDLCDTIYAARREKPMCAILSESAYSAGYAIASCAPKLYVPRTGGTGSIGVICMHVDYSKWLSKEGIAVTLIQYGARKADGSQFKPLSDKALKSFQADIDTWAACSTAGGAQSQTAGGAHQILSGRHLHGRRGVSAGLADAVMAPMRPCAPSSSRFNPNGPDGPPLSTGDHHGFESSRGRFQLRPFAGLGRSSKKGAEPRIFATSTTRKPLASAAAAETEECEEDAEEEEARPDRR
jgi:hypothetical protein